MSTKSVLFVSAFLVSSLFVSFVSHPVPATANASQSGVSIPLSLLIKRPETPHGKPLGLQAPA